MCVVRCNAQGTTHRFHHEDAYTAVIKKKEVIRMELHCETKPVELIFKRGKEILYNMELPDRESWFPAIALGFPSWKLGAKLVPIQ